MQVVDQNGGLTLEFQLSLLDLVNSISGTGGTIASVTQKPAALQATYLATQNTEDAFFADYTATQSASILATY